MNDAERTAVEELAAQVPSAKDIANKHTADQRANMDRMVELQNRKFAVEQATKACAAGGYEVGDVVKLAKEFHTFLTGG